MSCAYFHIQIFEHIMMIDDILMIWTNFGFNILIIRLQLQNRRNWETITPSYSRMTFEIALLVLVWNRLLKHKSKFIRKGEKFRFRDFFHFFCKLNFIIPYYNDLAIFRYKFCSMICLLPQNSSHYGRLSLHCH